MFRTRSICLFLVIVVLSPNAPAQWMQTHDLRDSVVTCFGVSGTNLLAAAFSGYNLFGGLYLSTNTGTSWTRTGLTTISGKALAVSDTNLFAGTVDSIFVSTDMGRTWSAATGDFPRPYSIVALSASNSNVFTALDVQKYNGGAYLYSSTDNGSSWAKTLTVLYFPVSALTVCGTRVFAGYAGGSGTGGVYVSTDWGKSWRAGALGDAIANTFAVVDTNLFTGTYSGVYLSTDNGTSWKTPSSGLTGLDVQALAVSDPYLFAGTADSGVFVSTNMGVGWTPVNSGLTHKKVRALATFAGCLFAGTYGGGVWRRPLSEMCTSADPAATELPSRVSLFQNYPNPFNPSTTIKYELPQKSHVTLTIYNTLGQLVAVLANGEQEAGYHEVKFDGSGLSSGVYFYRMQARSFVQTRKLVLTK